ncbi:hypothetical protein HMPREF1043_1272 [Streptococcus anginosus subsp. whileyi CCUG 39159]|uniref:Uncharacterized protein n=1 Tax=Streptococcus anginosus subsp. whileyi CCUG 39159 TaxID=1095729 RepID=I0SHZ4_STRAP|nr:hypothetical protein HMPREF1043_1272 [Streptococcus anginosus subsp. whileyi CCUG 39159]
MIYFGHSSTFFLLLYFCKKISKNQEDSKNFFVASKISQIG